MASLLSRFETALGEYANFDVDDISGNNTENAGEYIAKIDALLDKVSGPGGAAACLVGCLPAYLQCRKDNPTYPPAAICDVALAQCVSNCQQGV